MTLDEAIQHAQNVANNGCDQCAKDHQQLADWLKELKELRELGWHPTSEPPKDEEEVIAAGDYSTTRAVFHEGKYYIAEYYHNPESLNCALNGVKWWCYPPKEE